MDEILEVVVWKTTELLNAKGAIFRILNRQTEQLELYAASGLGKEYLEKGPVSSYRQMARPYRKNEVIVINDIQNDSRVQYPQEAMKEGIRMILDLPLSLLNDDMGILRLYFTKHHEILEDEKDFMIAVAQQCSCAIDKARLIETQQSRYDKLVLQTAKMSALGRMAAGIAHEINNPLAGILLYSSNMIKKVPPDGQLKDGLDIIVHETIRCRGIIQGLLDFSREREPEKTLANINDVIGKALNILENEFRLNRITVETDLSEEMASSFLDENQMEQVFVNLLINSVEAMDEGGRIDIKTRTDAKGKCMEIEFEDTGSGLPEETLNRIFEPFFSTKSKGTGLGLAVSYGIVQNHMGDIQAYSEPDKGARFMIRIPLLQQPPSMKTEGSKNGTP
ncbi:MAG: GAF domain-containing protein [Desulfobacterales bacterium]|nr:GAF domain-containing protein [Desulfobacterales bacterium]